MPQLDSVSFFEITVLVFFAFFTLKLVLDHMITEMNKFMPILYRKINIFYSPE